MEYVLSSQDHVYDNLMQLDALPGSLAYSTDRKAGGDVFDIHYIHMVDYVHEVPVKVQIQQPAMKILRADGEANKIVKSGVPVLLIVHGTLPINKGVVVPEVKFMVSFRLSRPFESGLSFIREIAGKTGEMSITMSELHAAFPSYSSTVRYCTVIRRT